MRSFDLVPKFAKNCIGRFKIRLRDALQFSVLRPDASIFERFESLKREGLRAEPKSVHHRIVRRKTAKLWILG
ncbi:hypothetical protein BES34_003535 [Leptospira inadai serovar Lyme]|uniref:Uncharacterized protein n=1 Tax=Leptospira inadai serovar Lyme TaxID=293084 RepID=A0ABX4YN02_9LEPT|nr:hypothetical protein BES34_003535 [Leptospira inadai serovar Lyme]